MKKKFKFTSKIGLAALILLTVAFVFSGSRSLQRVTPRVSGETLIKESVGAVDSTTDDLFLINDTVQTKYGSTVPTVSLQGNLSSFEDAGKIELNDRTFEVRRGTLFWSTVTDEGSTEEALSYFGKENTFTTDGREIARGFYVPQPLKLGFGNGSNFEFKRDEGIKLYWNPDERNEYPLFVVLQYVSDKSDGLVTKQLEFNDRDGAGEITPEDLAELPSDQKLILYAGRGNAKAVAVRDRETDLVGLAITSVPGIVLH